MRVRLVAFASAREALEQTLGGATVDYELPDGSDLDALRRSLIERQPAFEAMWPRLAVAIDNELVRGNAPLSDGQEVALLPPVSGGQTPRAALVDRPLSADEVRAAVSSSRRGAVVVFLGNVRDSHDGRAVERLTYDAYRQMALAVLERIVDEESDATADVSVAVHHRLGDVGAGDTSVVIAAAAPHRAAAYAASRQVLERLKQEAPIWKREHYGDGEAVWREVEALA